MPHKNAQKRRSENKITVIKKNVKVNCDKGRAYNHDDNANDGSDGDDEKGAFENGFWYDEIEYSNNIKLWLQEHGDEHALWNPFFIIIFFFIPSLALVNKVTCISKRSFQEVSDFIFNCVRKVQHKVLTFVLAKFKKKNVLLNKYFGRLQSMRATMSLVWQQVGLCHLN